MEEGCCWVDTLCGTNENDSMIIDTDNNHADPDEIKERNISIVNNNEVTEESDISNVNRRIWVVTTAALPWMTGTAMNPLMRALFLAKNRQKGFVTLVIPWLNERKHREQLYGKVLCFSDGEEGMKEQTDYIRKYSRDRCAAELEAENLGILFYPSIYNEGFGSIFPTVDICSLIPDEEADMAILEEPEHLNWFRVPSDKPSLENKDKKTSEEGPSDEEKTSKEIEKSNTNKVHQFGWAEKFRHVVGIIHTNYAAYARQNGVGTAVLGDPINIASALVIRAYCHKIIKLSPVLPIFARGKETVENVHGVRNEFLIPPCKSSLDNTDTLQGASTSSCAEVYFIGKIVWAKGFDLMLKVQDRYRRKSGDYFPIDIYGTGPDEEQIKRAFHGRIDHENVKNSRESSPKRKETKEKDLQTDPVFENPLPIRNQSHDSLESMENACPLLIQDGRDPLSILRDLTEKSVDTTIKTTQAVNHLADSAIQTGLSMIFITKPSKSSDEGEKQNKSKQNFVFEPPKSRFELRRHRIPANFHGRKDHALLRDLPYKIFFNPSVSEVLCTTTAEALAMGFFVIIPKHPSNDFFFQFTNCLAYSNEKECVQYLQWALDKGNKPTPLSEEEKNMFTWEAATSRLVKASLITKAEMSERLSSGMIKMDKRIAWLHSESGKKGKALRKLFIKKDNGKDEEV